MSKVYILGVGAVGIHLATRLQKKGIEAILIHTSRTGIFAENIQFRVIDPTGNIEEFSIFTGSIDQFEQMDGIIVVAAKAFGNESIAKKLRKIRSTAPLVIMQNGLNVEKAYVEQGFSQIYRCVLYVTSQVIAPREIRYKPVNVSPIGIIKGDQETLNHIVETLNTPIFEFIPSLEIEKLAWQKAILNSVFNSICPLINVDNGIFVRDEEVLELAKEVIREILQVTEVLGIHLEEDQIVDQVMHISNASSGQLISTLQDINAQRPTEIDSLNLAIDTIARNLYPPLEVHKTLLLGQLIKFRTQNY